MKPLPQKPEFSLTSPDAYYVRAAQFYNAARRMGYPNVAAIGLMVAQPDMESAFKDNVVGDHGAAYGPCQWHEPRISNILRGTGLDVRRQDLTPAQEVQAIDWELKHTHTMALSLILAARTTAEAARAATKFYEGAGADEAAERRALDAEWWTGFVTREWAWVEEQR